MNTNEIIDLISTMEPKIIKSLTNTSYQEKEDLKQEIYLKIIEIIKKGNIKDVPGFWDMQKML